MICMASKCQLGVGTNAAHHIQWCEKQQSASSLVMLLLLLTPQVMMLIGLISPASLSPALLVFGSQLKPCMHLLALL